MQSLHQLKKRSDFLRIGQSLLKYNCPFFIMKTAINPDLPYTSVGYTVTKKIGKAVVRNKIKRQLRVLCRELTQDFLEKYGYVIIVRSPFLSLDFVEIRNQLKKSLLYLQKKNNKNPCVIF